MVARRHHYVPQCYLKAFAVPRKASFQLNVFDRVTKKTFMTAVENVALQKDFNTIELEGQEPDAFENAMARVESDIAPALTRIIAAESLENEDDRALLLNLLGLLAVRNPRHRERFRGFQEEVAKKIMSLTLATPERWENQTRRAREAGFMSNDPKITYEDMKRFHESDDYTVEVSNEQHISLEMGGFNALLPHLFRRKWAVLIASKASGGFVTSDHPVCVMWSDPAKRGRFHGPGYGLAGTEVLFPLSPRLGLVGAFEIDNGVVEIDDGAVSTFNGAIIAYAERQVYARDANFHYAMGENEPARKASRLINDKRFSRVKDGDRSA